tara:strand:- start:887 stop:1141 length:255 start_codon:yes stop_codon:yes gene_type:complete
MSQPTQPTQPLQLNVDLKNTEKVEFDGQVLVGEGFVLRKVSKFVTGQEEDGIMPIPVFYNVTTGKIIKETLPKDLREEYEDQAV